MQTLCAAPKAGRCWFLAANTRAALVFAAKDDQGSLEE